MPLDPARTPVIIAVGEAIDRPERPEDGLDPIGLMAAAVDAAEADAGRPLRAEIDALDIVHEVSWWYEDTAARVGERLGVSPRRLVYRPGGGETPVAILHEAALRIAQGLSELAVVCGGEAQYTVDRARKARVELPWAPQAASMEHPWELEAMLHPLALAHGLVLPAFVYPIYENATAARWGETPAAARAASAKLWAQFSEVAADNPFAWSRTRLTAEAIGMPSAENRIIAWPYTKHMVANPNVNQGAAVVLGSLAKARALGIPEERLVYVHGGAAAREPRNWLARDRFDHAPAQEAVLLRAAAIAGGAPRIAVSELYSCFPVVPKMARRTLGLGPEIVTSVTGGHSFFGGPMNDVMTHAAAALVHRLRRTADGTGLLYGQGEFVTKHHALVVGRTAPSDPLGEEVSVQAEADERRGPVPALVEAFEGPAAIESFTVIYDRAGAPERGIVILRTDVMARTVARVTDAAAIARLTDLAASPIGLAGTLQKGADGLAEWTPGG